MSTKKPILSAVLTVLGLLGLASADPADPRPPEPLAGTPPASADAPGASPSPSGEADPAAPPAAAPQGVILLTDGQVVQGAIVEDETGCLLKTPFGSKRFPKGRIEKTFGTMREAYEYKLSQFPDEDTQERLKLAQWCIAQNMQVEAKSQLNSILRLNPKHPQARAMIEKIEQAEVRKAQRQFDPGVQQAKANADEMPNDTGPKEMDPRAIPPRPRTRPMIGGPADVPEIFNLSRPAALKLSEEFNGTIHQILQVHCAKCHNDRYPGDFQLRQVRNRREQTRDTLNLNLEATLQLIDPANPSKSEILSSTLRPHGYGKAKKPIFRGSNDPSYQRLAHWVNSVCKPIKMDAVRQASAQADLAGEEERFAAERALNLEAPGASTGAVAPTRRNPAGRQPVQGMRGAVPSSRVQAQANADPNEFPLSDVSAPSASPRRSANPAGATAATVTDKTDQGEIAHPADAPIATDAGYPGIKPAGKGIASAEPFDLSKASSKASAGDKSAATAKKPKAPPVKVDPALLEGVLKARNGGK